MKGKRLITLAFLLFVCLGMILFTFNIREAEAATFTVTRTFTSLAYDGDNHNFTTDYQTVWNSIFGIALDYAQINIIGQRYPYAGTFYLIWRSFVYFDTSIIPNNAVITSAIIGLYIEANYSITDFNVTIQNGQPTYPHIPLVGGDYNKAWYSGNGGSRNTSEISALNYWNITLNTDGISWISKTEITKLCLRSDRDINGQAPSTYEWIDWYGREQGEDYAPKLYVTYEVAEAYRYIVHGPYYESGAVADCITNITLFSKTENPISFVLNGSSGTADTTTLDVEQAGWYFQWNASGNITRNYYLSATTFDEFWVHVADSSKTYASYIIKFMDLAGVLTSMPYVKVQRYINGMKTVEKAKVDVEKKLVLYLEKYASYTLIIEDTTSSYTFGDLLFTSETSITLTLKGIEFPQDIILAYQYNRIYAYRHSNQSSISVVYQDTKAQLANVSIRILFENGSIVSVIYPYWQNNTYYFNYTYASAAYDTTYLVRVMIYHSAYGNMAYNTILAQGWTQQPWVLPIGNIPGFNMPDFIPIIIIFACFLAFSQINAPTGAFIGTAMAIIQTWWGWIDIPSGLLVAAVVFDILFGLAYARRHG